MDDKDRLANIEKMVKSMYRHQQMSTLVSSIKWILIIGVTVWSWLYVQPYLESILRTYQSVQGAMESASSTSVNIQSSIQNLFNQYSEMLR